MNALREAGINSASLNSSISSEERQEILADLECGHPKTRLLYGLHSFSILKIYLSYVLQCWIALMY